MVIEEVTVVVENLVAVLPAASAEVVLAAMHPVALAGVALAGVHQVALAGALLVALVEVALVEDLLVDSAAGLPAEVAVGPCWTLTATA